jgi:hypothetical protein
LNHIPNYARSRHGIGYRPLYKNNIYSELLYWILITEAVHILIASLSSSSNNKKENKTINNIRNKT